MQTNERIKSGQLMFGFLAVVSFLLAITATPAVAGPVTLEATYSTGIANGWVRVERWRDTLSAFTQEAFPPDGRGDQSGQRKTFLRATAAPIHRAS